jgi:hypothetical protein
MRATADKSAKTPAALATGDIARLVEMKVAAN